MSAHLALALGLYKYKRANEITLSYEELVKFLINGLDNHSFNNPGLNIDKQDGIVLNQEPLVIHSKDKQGSNKRGEVFQVYKKPLPRGQNGETFNDITIKCVGVIKLWHALRYTILSPNSIENCRYIIFLINEIILRRGFTTKPKHELYHCMISTIRYETEYNKFIQLKFNQLTRVLVCLPFNDILIIMGKLIYNYIKWFKHCHFPNKTIEKLINKYDFIDKFNRMKTGILKPNLFIYLFHTIISTMKLVYPKVNTLILALLIWLDDPMLLDIYHQ